MIYEIKNLSFSYNKDKQIFNNASLNILEGELLVILGKNGSGKSTLFSLLMGLNKNYQGSIKLNKEVKELKEREIATICGYVPQSHDVEFGFSVFEYCLLGCAAKTKMFSSPTKEDEQQVLKVLKQLDLLEFADREYGELSGGERQLVSIARALVTSPKVLIFDEPTAHLDYANQIKILKTIKELNKQGYTIIVSTHDPNHPLLLDSNVALLNNNGCIEKGSNKEMVTEEKLKKIYGSNVKIRYNKEFKCNICIFTI